MTCLNLKIEMMKKNISLEEIASCLGIHRNSVANKIKGESSFTIEESIKIQENFFPNHELRYLFQRERVID